MLKKLKRLQKPSKTLKRPSKENQLSILYRSNKAKISLLHITHNLKRPSKLHLYPDTTLTSSEYPPLRLDPVYLNLQ